VHESETSVVHRYTSEEFHEQCKEEYLKQREEFRRTNVAKKKRKKPQYFGE
jgi:hypothetical protein